MKSLIFFFYMLKATHELKKKGSVGGEITGSVTEKFIFLMLKATCKLKKKGECFGDN